MSSPGHLNRTTFLIIEKKNSEKLGILLKIAHKEGQRIESSWDGKSVLANTLGKQVV